MSNTTRITPEDVFPVDLGRLSEAEVQVLHSRVHRALDYEYAQHAEPNPETEIRLAELTEELDRREVVATAFGTV